MAAGFARGFFSRIQVRATSLLCLLGLGLGLGSLFLYKICSRLFYRSPSTPPTQRKHLLNRTADARPESESSTPETPSDSGISACTASTMGNNASDSSASISPNSPYASVVYNSGGRRSHGRQGGDSPKISFRFSSKPLEIRKRGSKKDKKSGSAEAARPSSAEFPSHGDIGSGTAAGSHSDGAESVGAYSMLPNYSPASLYEKNQQLQDSSSDFFGGSDISWSSPERDDDQSQLKCRDEGGGTEVEVSRAEEPSFSEVKHSTPHSSGSRERNMSESGALKRKSFITHSHPNEAQDLSSRRCNSDRSDSVSGVTTPDSDLFEPGDVGLKTATSMEHLQSELTEIQKEINEMTDNIYRLNSQENLAEEFLFSTSPRGEKFNRAIKVLRKHKLQSPDRSTSQSRSLSVDQDVTDSSTSEAPSGEFMWDYRSDLYTENSTVGTSHFSAHRPDFSRTTTQDGDGSLRRPSSDRGRFLFKQGTSMESSMGDSFRLSTQASISDMYIDDDLSQIDSLQAAASPALEESMADSLPSGASSSPHKLNQSASPSQAGPASAAAVESAPSGKHHANGDSVLYTIGERRKIAEYVRHEWRGHTEKAQAVRKGYQAIPSHTGLRHLRVIRGDNYCALRATLYQAIVHNIPLLKNVGSLEDLSQRLEVFRDHHHHQYLQTWNFANRLPFSRDQVYNKVMECVQCLYAQAEEISSHISELEREEKLTELLNTQEEVDLKLMEAVKVLMMLNAMHLHQDSVTGNEVPVFVWLLFARDTSSDPESFLKNHLNPVGNVAGLEQVEMFLLAHTLGLGIKVVRPSMHGQEDFITCFKEEGVDSVEVVHLIAEDDRHYNVLVS